jgi:hypothetical protein
MMHPFANIENSMSFFPMWKLTICVAITRISHAFGEGKQGKNELAGIVKTLTITPANPLPRTASARHAGRHEAARAP